MPEKKILLVDADVASRNFIARKLQHEYQVIETGSAKEGLIYAWRDRPALAIIEPSLPDLRGEEVAQKLKQDPRTAQMPLIALSSDPNPMREKSCLVAGFDAYITKSGQAVSLLNEAMARLLGGAAALASSQPAVVSASTPLQTTPVPSVKKGGLLIVALSAKGGVGTSSILANLAMSVAQLHKDASVAVMDMVLPIGSIAPIVGYTGEQNLVTIASLPSDETTPEFFSKNLTKIRDWKFHLLAGSPDPESSNRLNVNRIWDIVIALKSAYDYVLIDLGRSLSRFSLPLIQYADVVALIVSPDLSTVTMTNTLLEFFNNKNIKSESIFPILNRVVGLEGLSKAEVEKMLGMDIRYIVPHVGGNFTLSNNSHIPFSIQHPGDAASVLLREMAQKMTDLALRLRE